MRREDTPRSTASAQAVEKKYLDLQAALRDYRQWRDYGSIVDEDEAQHSDESHRNAHLELQDAVLTFYELLRPYLRKNRGLEHYWKGALVSHPEQPHDTTQEAIDYYREHSTGIWQIQEHKQTLADYIGEQPSATTNGETAVADGGENVPQTLDEWGEAIALPPGNRILQLYRVMDSWVFEEGRFSVIGLRNLDEWTTEKRQETKNQDGFMTGASGGYLTDSGGNTKTVVVAQPPKKVETAARMLVEAANELGAIAEYDTSDDTPRQTPRPE